VVYSTLHTISAAQTINRILGMFETEQEKQVRERLAETLRYVISQRLVPKQGGGRLLITELMGSNMRSREAIALGENENRRLTDVIEAGGPAGWHTFEQSLLKAYEEDLVTEETALLYCVNRTQMRQRLDAARKRRETAPMASTLKMKATERPVPIPRPVAVPPPPVPGMEPAVPSMPVPGIPPVAPGMQSPTPQMRPVPPQPPVPRPQMPRPQVPLPSVPPLEIKPAQ
jgi:twitching motility protein PilT